MFFYYVRYCILVFVLLPVLLAFLVYVVRSSMRAEKRIDRQEAMILMARQYSSQWPRVSGVVLRDVIPCILDGVYDYDEDDETLKTVIRNRAYWYLYGI